MCGIYGHFSFSGTVSVDSEIAALDQLTHRGPDGFGLEIGDYNTPGSHRVIHNRRLSDSENIPANYFIGHRRLSIIDLSDTAFQPMETQSSRYSITFNGEIYNYVELKKELEELGYPFKTDHSDTEVLLGCYETWGKSCVGKLRGMFAFAIYDREKGEVFLARDRIGQKTLYYRLDKGGFSFASELPSLTANDTQLRLDIHAVNLYLAMGYIPHPHSIYEGINKLPPASHATFNLRSSSIEMEEYWDLQSEIDNSADFESALAKTKEKLGESVFYRLRSDVSMGAFISGGIDSTLIVKNISEQSQQKLDIYGADFPNTDRSEKPYIEEAARRYRQNLKLAVIDSSKIGNIDEIVKVFDEPFDGASSIALFDLFEIAAKDHKVILTGDGGDEMFAGYDRYIEFFDRQKKFELLKALKLPELLANIMIRLNIFAGKARSLKRFINNSPMENYTSINSKYDLSSLLKKPYQASPADKLDSVKNIYDKASSKQFTPLKRLQYLELKTILPGRMLYKLDRFSMRYSVEARSPFLDHKLSELAFSLPDSVTQKNRTGKAILKQILIQDFGESFVHRKKSGFGNPLDLWFAADTRDAVLDILNQPSSAIYQLLDYQQTHRAFPEIQTHSAEQQPKMLWRLLVLAHFLKQNSARLDLAPAQ